MNCFYKESKSKKKDFLFFFFGGGGGVGVGGVGGVEGGVDGWTDKQAQTNLPLQGITMNKYTSYGPDKLNL